EVAELRQAQRRRLASAASAQLRAEENRRILEIRKLVLTSVNNKDILLEDIVEGGRLRPGDPVGVRGVIVGHQTRPGPGGVRQQAEKRTLSGVYRVVDNIGKVLWRDEDDKVQCIVLLRKGEESLPALAAVTKKVAELNRPDSGKLLPGVQIEPYYNRTDLI